MSKPQAQRHMAPAIQALPIALAGLLGLLACSQSAPLDRLEAGETGRVVRVIDGDALVLSTGLSVRLVGIEAPAPERRNREGEPFAQRSKRMLEDLAMGRTVRLIYPGITRDRYDRALAYVETADNLGPKLWLNMEMVTAGGARARIYPDTAALGDLLMSAEAKAREDATGLWALSDYRVVEANLLAPDTRGFYLISGRLGDARGPSDDRATCERALVGADLRLKVMPGAKALCNLEGQQPTITARGYVRDGQLEITHGLNVEISAP